MAIKKEIPGYNVTHANNSISSLTCNCQVIEAHTYRIASNSIRSDSTMLFTKVETVAFVMTSSNSTSLLRQ